MKWISVKDVTPMMGMPVLVDGVEDTAIIAYRVADEDFGYRWIACTTDEWVVGIKHWTPLPEPPINSLVI